MTVAEEEYRKRLKDITDLMDTAHGRRIAHRILASSGCLARPANFIDPAQISYSEGKRSIGFDIYSDIMDAAPKKFQIMILEAQERQEKINLRLLKEQGETNNE